jgi:hypothetical protein
MQKNSVNGEKFQKFRIDSSFIFIALVFYPFYPAKIEKKMQNSSVPVHLIQKIQIFQINSIDSD